MPKEQSQIQEVNNGAAEGNRTPTLSPETDFESVASTSSATAAQCEIHEPEHRRSLCAWQALKRAY